MIMPPKYDQYCLLLAKQSLVHPYVIRARRIVCNSGNNISRNFFLYVPNIEVIFDLYKRAVILCCTYVMWPSASYICDQSIELLIVIVTNQTLLSPKESDDGSRSFRRHHSSKTQIGISSCSLLEQIFLVRHKYEVFIAIHLEIQKWKNNLDAIQFSMSFLAVAKKLLKFYVYHIAEILACVYVSHQSCGFWGRCSVHTYAKQMDG